jgi:hypothetical protein
MSNDETGEGGAASVLVGVHLDATARRTRSLSSDVRERAVLGIADRDHADRNASTRMLEVISAPRPQEQHSGGCKL